MSRQILFTREGFSALLNQVLFAESNVSANPADQRSEASRRRMSDAGSAVACRYPVPAHRWT